MKQLSGQISIFDILDPPKDEEPFICDSCGYDSRTHCCLYDTKDDYCVLGSKWIPKEDLRKPGTWVDKMYVGREITFDEITRMIGKIIVIDKSTESAEGFKVIKVERIVSVEDNTQRRLIYYDGTRQRGLVNERYFSKDTNFPQKAYLLEA